MLARKQQNVFSEGYQGLANIAELVHSVGYGVLPPGSYLQSYFRYAGWYSLGCDSSERLFLDSQPFSELRRPTGFETVRMHPGNEVLFSLQLRLCTFGLTLESGPESFQ